MTKTQTHRIEAEDGKTFSAYVSLPQRPNGHAVIVAHEIFGLTPSIRGVADRFAQDGYWAIAPDLYWRMSPGICLTHSKEDLAHALQLVKEFNEDAAVSDIAATVAYAEQHVEGKVAVTGLCLGGKLAYLAAGRGIGAAAVAYYGVGIEQMLDRAPHINTPLLLFFGGMDRYVPAIARDAITACLKDNPKVQVDVHDDADHGFYTRGDAATIDRARRRTNAFLRGSLGNP